MRNRLALLVAAASFAFLDGCGDNSRACGPGTVEAAGVCVPGATCGFGTKPDEQTGECVPDGSVVCSDGTVFNPLTGSCELDESACQGGTVLVEDACVDPSTGLVVDVQEGPEPNGLGIIEVSDAQAGNVVLDASDAFVIHGTINPHRDFDGNGAIDPDVDTFVLQVGAPTFVRMTADGLGGLAAGFIVATSVEAGDPLEGWERIGMSLVSDTSVRELFLPRAGTYRIAIADTRTLVDRVTAQGSLAAPGGAAFEYYVSLLPFTPPQPTPLALSNGQLSTTRTKPSDKIEVLAVQLGTGLNLVELTTPSALTLGALAARTNAEVASTDDERIGTARVLVGDVGPQDESTIVIDEVFTLLPTTVTYTLDVTSSIATPLSTTGGMVSAQATTNTVSDVSGLNLFSFEVTAADATMGMQLQWSPAIVGQVFDAVGEPVATFTNPTTTTTTWTTYRGLVRLARPGRYYMAVYAPSATSTSSITVTSTLAELAPIEVTQSTPTMASIGTFRAVPLTYHAGMPGDPWQQFDVTGSNTGGQAVGWFDPASAYGRLDPLATSSGTLAGDVAPLFAATFATAGGPVGRVVIDDPRPYYIKLTASNPTTNPTATMRVDPRAQATDLGSLAAAGASVSRTGETIDSSAPQRFYIVRIPLGRTVTITVTPTSSVNTQFRRLRADETALGPLVSTSLVGADVETFVQAGATWTAFVVSAVGPLINPRTFDVSVQIQ